MTAIVEVLEKVQKQSGNEKYNTKNCGVNYQQIMCLLWPGVHCAVFRQRHTLYLWGAELEVEMKCENTPRI